MKVTKTTVHKLLIKAKGCDAVEVFIEDPSPGFGQITILCLENAWTHFWGGIGDESMAEFFCKCDADYLVDLFLPMEKHRLLLLEKIIPTIKEALRQTVPNGSKCEFHDCKILK